MRENVECIHREYWDGSVWKIHYCKYGWVHIVGNHWVFKIIEHKWELKDEGNN